MSLRRLLPVAVLALALVPAAPAAADQAVAEIARQAPVAAYGGWEAWSRYDDATGRYTLVVAAPGQPAAPVGISTSSRPFDVSLGPDRNHNVAAVYQRCGSSGCDIRRYSTASGQRREALHRLLALLQRGHAGHLGRERRLHAARARLRRPVRQEPELVGAPAAGC